MKRWHALAGALALAAAGTARAQDAATPALDVGVAYTVDLSMAPAGSTDTALRYLHDLQIHADANLDKALGWHRAHAHVTLLDNHGKRANDPVATLQGVDNIEVGDAALRLFEAWVEQHFGQGNSVLVGMYDLNSEFYASETASLLINPTFGIGPELAGTGSNGPSIFPSSSPTVRLRHVSEPSGLFVLAAATNAKAGTLGDAGSIDLNFNEGLLLVGEVGVSREGLLLAMGAWSFTRRQDRIWSPDPDRPDRRVARGIYVQSGRRVWSADNRNIDIFLRGGVSMGRTTPFSWSAQGGILLAPLFTGRADSALSLGVAHSQTDRLFREGQRADGDRPSHGETVLELTATDTVAELVSIQPDVQLVLHPGGRLDAPSAVVTTLRLAVEL